MSNNQMICLEHFPSPEKLISVLKTRILSSGPNCKLNTSIISSQHCVTRGEKKKTKSQQKTINPMVRKRRTNQI